MREKITQNTINSYEKKLPFNTQIASGNMLIHGGPTQVLGENLRGLGY